MQGIGSLPGDLGGNRQTVGPVTDCVACAAHRKAPLGRRAMLELPEPDEAAHRKTASRAIGTPLLERKFSAVPLEACRD